MRCVHEGVAPSRAGGSFGAWLRPWPSLVSLVLVLLMKERACPPHHCGATSRLCASTMGGHGRTVARIAVSGAGWWGQGWHLPHLHRRSDAMVTAIVERAAAPRSSNAAETLQTAAALSAQYDAPVFESVEALLASSTEVDGLLVGVSHADHAHQATLAIDAGWHVLVEKPMTTSVSEARALASAAATHAEAGRFFAINNTANWREGCIKAADCVASGRIGHVQHVSANMHRHEPAL